MTWFPDKLMLLNPLALITVRSFRFMLEAIAITFFSRLLNRNLISLASYVAIKGPLVDLSRLANAAAELLTILLGKDPFNVLVENGTTNGFEVLIVEDTISEISWRDDETWPTSSVSVAFGVKCIDCSR